LVCNTLSVLLDFNTASSCFDDELPEEVVRRAARDGNGSGGCPGSR
jgi:hypothetical protein